MSEATRAPSGSSTSIFAMFDALETVTHRPGQLVTGVLGAVEGDWIMVDLDGATGRLPVGELDAPDPGTSLELFIDDVNAEGVGHSSETEVKPIGSIPVVGDRHR